MQELVDKFPEEARDSEVKAAAPHQWGNKLGKEVGRETAVGSKGSAIIAKLLDTISLIDRCSTNLFSQNCMF